MTEGKLKIKDVRQITPLRNYRFNSFVGHFISSSISPIFTYWFIKLKIKPNAITLLMISCGVIGAILFSFPNIYSKIGGFIFFHLWFIFDCSDGEVARITKNFSKYGKEMDFIAHLINHPLMNLSLFITYVQLNSNYSVYIAVIFLCFISMELMIRNFITFNTYILSSTNEIMKRSSFINYAMRQFFIYPNFILIFPVFILLDFYFNHHFSLYILLVWLTIYSIYFVKSLVIILYKFYKG